MRTSTSALSLALVAAAFIGYASDGPRPAAAAQAAAMPTTAMAYVTNAAISDRYEVEAGMLARERAQNADVKMFADMMVRDHTMTTQQLMATLMRAGMTAPPPPPLDAKKQAMLTELRNAPAGMFDARYKAQQVMAHEEALSLHRGYAEHGDNAQLKAFAAQTWPKVDMHLMHARSLKP
jgi:putative membrane protein